MARVENINIDVLKETSLNLDDSKRDYFPKLKEWIEGKSFPTFNQLVKFSKVTNVPFGYFFLSSIPEKKYPIPHYRTKVSSPFKPSNELFDTIQYVKEKQDWTKELLLEIGSEKLKFAGKYSTSDSIFEVANAISEILRLNGNWAFKLKSWKDSLRLLIERSEDAGIFVVVNGVVKNNTHRKLDVDEFRGFVLYDEIAPFIFLNGADFMAGKIFTIVHEIVHILIGASASFDLQQLTAAEDITERFCDSVAAEFLVPTSELSQYLNQHGKNYNQLARVFKVSQVVIARRLLDLNYIDKKEYFAFYNTYTQKIAESPSSPGGNFYNTAPYRISRRFFNLVNRSVKQNKILYRDAFRLTGLTPKTFDEYQKRVL